MRRFLYLLIAFLAPPALAGGPPQGEGSPPGRQRAGSTASVGAPPTAGLAEHLEAAWQRHPQARASAARAEAAAAGAEAAGWVTPGPGAVSVGGRTDRPWEHGGKREVELEYSVPLWLPGQWDAAREAARRGRSRVDADTSALRLELAGELREAWGAVVSARDALDLARRRLDTAGQLEADVARRLRAGEVSRVDANLASHERLAARGAVVEAGSALAQAEQAWQALTGGPPPLWLEEERVAEMPRPVPMPSRAPPPDGPRAAAEPLSAGTPAERAPRSITEPPSSAASSEPVSRRGDDEAAPAGHPGGDAFPGASDVHPRLRALAAAVDAARSSLHLATQTRRDAPELAVGVRRERGSFDERYGRTLGVSLRIPLASGARNREAEAGATAELLQADAELARARQRLELDLAKARRDIAAAESQLALARDRHTLTADNLHLADKAFRLGELDLPALLRARTQAYEAEADAARQQNALRLARARLNQTLGVLP